MYFLFLPSDSYNYLKCISRLKSYLLEIDRPETILPSGRSVYALLLNTENSFLRCLYFALKLDLCDKNNLQIN